MSFPSPGGLLDPEIEPTSPVSPVLPDGFFITVSPGKPHLAYKGLNVFTQNIRIELSKTPRIAIKIE